MGKTASSRPRGAGATRRGHEAQLGGAAFCGVAVNEAVAASDAAVDSAVAASGATRSTREGERSPGVSSDEVQKTVDAVSGATWGTRNRIMAGLFQRDLHTRADDMPAFAPPGEDIPQ